MKILLDDESWLQIFMRGQQKGLSSETLQRLAKEWKNLEEELQAIQQLLKTKYRSKNLTQYKERQKVIAALVRKGYSFDQVQAALQEMNSDE